MVTIRIRNWRPAMPSISGPRATVASTKPFTSKLTLWLGFDRVPACARTTAASWITRPWSSCASAQFARSSRAPIPRTSLRRWDDQSGGVWLAGQVPRRWTGRTAGQAGPRTAAKIVGRPAAAVVHAGGGQRPPPVAVRVVDPGDSAGADPPRVRRGAVRGQRGAAAAQAGPVAPAAAVPGLSAEPAGG